LNTSQPRRRRYSCSSAGELPAKPRQAAAAKRQGKQDAAAGGVGELRLEDMSNAEEDEDLSSHVSEEEEERREEGNISEMPDVSDTG